MKKNHCACAVAAVFVVGSCGALGGEDGSSIRFTDQTQQSGLVYSQVHGPVPKYPTFLGGGTVGDFNNDGYPDVFVLGNGGVADGFFVNNADGTFSDRADEWGMAALHYAFGASAADFNNDGYLDIFITSYGTIEGGGVRNGQLRLMRNNGPDAKGVWSFTDVAHEAGVNAVDPISTDGTGSAWGDVDLDGDLDLFVAGFNANRPTKRLFRNDGPDAKGVWRFTDVTEEAGIVITGRSSMFVPGLVDLSGDRYPDLLTIADYETSRYWENNADGSFGERTELAAEIVELNGMGLDYGDINGDGLIDFYATSIAWNEVTGPGNQLMVQQPDGSFVNTALEAGCFAGYWGWGAAMVDLDHDGDLDIVGTNGFQEGVNETPAQPAVVFENNGDGSSFTEIAEECGLVHWLDGRGLVKFDADNDGDLDIVIFASDDETAYFRNDLISGQSPVGDDRHWLRVVLGTRANDGLAPQGIGSTVIVRTGGVDRVLAVHSGSNHCSSSPVEVHTGLGSETVVDAVRVVWADGSMTTLTGVDADQVLRIEARAFAADVDGSGSADLADVTAFVDGLLAGDLGMDFTGDWSLDVFDVFAFLADFGAAGGG